MAFRDFLTWLEEAGCIVTRVDGVPDHVMLSRGGFHAILPASDAGTPRAGAEPAAEGQPTVRYPFTLTDDDGSVMVTFPDFPGATYGRTREEAIQRAHGLVADAIAIYLALDLPLPAPAAIANDQQVVVAMPPDRGSTPGRHVLA